MNLDNLSISEAEDSSVYNPQSGDSLVWDSVTSTWTNAASGTSGSTTSTTFYSRVATTAALATCVYDNGAGTLTKSTNGALANIDGVTMAAEDTVLVKDQAAQLQNGLYEVTTLGSAGVKFVLTRLTTYDETAEIYPSQVNVIEGTINANKYFLQSTVDPVIGTDSIVYGSIPAPITTTAQLGFVDTVTTAVLPNSPTYTSGTTNATYPGYLATYSATTNGAFPTISGVAPFINMTILVKDQSDATKNGDYILLKLGSASTKWLLRRITYAAGSFYPRLWEVYQGTFKGSIFQQDTKTLTNLLIGTTGNIAFTATITATTEQTFIDALTISPAPLDTMMIQVTDPASTTVKKFSWANIKVYLLSYFDTVFPRKTVASTGSVISFEVPVIWNTFGTPSTANLTDDLTNAKIGYIQKIYHNKAVEPTYPAGWVKMGTGTYTNGVLNVIFAEWVSGTRVEYWVVTPS